MYSDYNQYGTPTYKALIYLSQFFPKDERGPFANGKRRDGWFAHDGSRIDACDEIFILASEVLEEDKV